LELAEVDHTPLPAWPPPALVVPPGAGPAPPPCPPPSADTAPATAMLPLLSSRQLPVQAMAELPSITIVDAV
jgi:hypothetical protein